MSFSSQATTDLAAFFNEFAETVSYTPVGGVATDITAIVTRESIFQETYVRGPLTAMAEITVKASEVATPQYGDLFTFDSQTWEFDPSRGVFYEDGYIYEIGLVRRD